MADPLTPLRRNPGIVTRGLSRVAEGVRAVEGTRESTASFWDDWNRTALAADGPLWLALGDSLTQGIGASDPLNGWVPLVLDRVRELTGERWRVVNVSVTGGQLADVVDRAVPSFENTGQTPDMTTCMIGQNDILTPFGWSGSRQTASRLVDALPRGAIVGRIGGGPLSRRKQNVINEVFTAAEERGDITLFNPFDWPTWQGAMAADRFHPNDQGYAYMADAAWSAIERHLGTGSG